MGRGDTEGTLMKKEVDVQDDREGIRLSTMGRARQVFGYVESQSLWERE